jgi:hypothetical protein
MPVFRPRPVYIHSSEMLPVGKYDGRHRPLKSFFGLIDGLEPFIDAAPIPRSRIDHQTYRFMIGVEPQNADHLAELKVGDPLRHQGQDGAIRINDVPIRCLYRKTLEGLARLRPFRREKA